MSQQTPVVGDIYIGRMRQQARVTDVTEDRVHLEFIRETPTGMDAFALPIWFFRSKASGWVPCVAEAPQP